VHRSRSSFGPNQLQLIERVMGALEPSVPVDFTKLVTEARQPHLSRDEQFRYGPERVLDCIAAALPSMVEPPVAAHPEGREDRDD